MSFIVITAQDIEDSKRQAREYWERRLREPELPAYFQTSRNRCPHCGHRYDDPPLPVERQEKQPKETPDGH